MAEKEKTEVTYVPKIPEEFMKTAQKNLDEVTKKTIAYKRKNNKVTYNCCECGAEYEVTLHDYEGTMESYKPKRHDKYTCQKCGCTAELENEGYFKQYTNTINQVILQKTDEAFFIRQVECQKACAIGHEAIYTFQETFRAEIQGTKVRKYTTIHHTFYGTGYTDELWCSDNIANYAHIREAILFSGSYETLKEAMPYLDMEKIYNFFYNGQFDKTKFDSWMADIIMAYARFPGLEILSKLGFTGLVKQIIYKEGKTNLINKKAKKLADVLKIRPDLVSKYRERQTDLEVYQFMTKEKIGSISDEQFRELKQFISSKEYLYITKWIGWRKAINRINKYAKETYKAGNAKLTMGRSMALDEYSDYLKMRSDMGYDMTKNLYPKSLKQAHDEMVDEKIKREDEWFINNKNKEYPKIATKYKNLKKRYELTIGDFIFVVPQNAGDIISEGRKLHHCVGRDTYLSRHNKGTSHIIFMRDKKKPDKPFVTIEINSKEILQWYGEHDNKPQDKKVHAAVAEYEKRCCNKKEKIAV
ncbi:MAG: PcfJ domain-containing protein [Clostridium sp.]|nr:PcfJ domain-containing protein [Clostridium sp.]MCM1208994.1 PcfJ domain-containing protein [Ruminococcus sp.]